MSIASWLRALRAAYDGEPGHTEEWKAGYQRGIDEALHALDPRTHEDEPMTMIAHPFANDLERVRETAMLVRARLMSRVESLDQALAEVAELGWRIRSGASHPKVLDFRMAALEERVQKIQHSIARKLRGELGV